MALCKGGKTKAISEISTLESSLELSLAKLTT